MFLQLNLSFTSFTIPNAHKDCQCDMRPDTEQYVKWFITCTGKLLVEQEHN